MTQQEINWVLHFLVAFLIMAATRNWALLSALILGKEFYDGAHGADPVDSFIDIVMGVVGGLAASILIEVRRRKGL